MSPAGPLEIRSLDPVAWLATGQAVQRVLLRARCRRVVVVHEQPIEVAELRPKLAEGHWPSGRPSATSRALRIRAVGQAGTSSRRAGGACRTLSRLVERVEEGSELLGHDLLVGR